MLEQYPDLFSSLPAPPQFSSQIMDCVYCGSVCTYMKHLLVSILQEKLPTCTLFGGFCCVLPTPTLRRSYNICILHRKHTFCTSFVPRVEYEVTQNTEHLSAAQKTLLLPELTEKKETQWIPHTKQPEFFKTIQ